MKKRLIRIIISLVLFFTLFTVDKIINLETVVDMEFPILPFCLYLVV